MLQSALARPQASVLGEDAYPSIHAKAAALLDRLSLTNDEAYHLVMAVASGELDDVAAITTLMGRAARRAGGSGLNPRLDGTGATQARDT